MLEIIQYLRRDFKSWGEIFTIPDFISKVKKELTEHGIKNENSRLVFCVCSDDINRLQERETVENELIKEFNGEFHLGSLAAYPIGGISGILAASHHTPHIALDQNNKRENLVFFISPHVGISIEAQNIIYGKIIRPGQHQFTSCCGAIIKFWNQIKKYEEFKDFKLMEDFADDISFYYLQKDFFDNYLNQLDDIKEFKTENEQIVALTILNYQLIFNKVKQLIEISLKEKWMETECCLIGGITINSSLRDFFILKNFIYFNK